MDLLPKEKYKRIPLIIFYIGVILFSAFLFFKYLLFLILPFIIAYVISVFITPVIRFINRKTAIPKKLLSIFFVLIIIALLALIIVCSLNILLTEIKEIFSHLTENYSIYIEKADSIVSSLEKKFPALEKLGGKQYIMSYLSDFGSEMLKSATYALPELIGKVISALPNAFFVSFVLIMASYYLCSEPEKPFSFLKSIFPENYLKIFGYIREKTSEVLFKFFKGYLLTLSLTFIQLYVGFILLDIDYSFTLALLVAFLDILPVIGVGTILIPWALIKLFAGAYFQGFGLLIIFAVVSVIREVLEPKIIGKSIGLHPLLTLMSMYVGLKACGIAGLLIFPALATLIKNILSSDGTF